MSRNTAEPVSIQGVVNYLGPMTERPVFYSQDYHRNNLNLQPHEVRIRDFRHSDIAPSIAREGFQLVPHRTTVSDFRSAEQVQNRYLPEIIELIRSLTGAPKVTVSRPVLRWSEREAHPEEVNSRPGRFAHVDYGRDSFHAFARGHLANDPEAERWLSGRYAAYNIWRVTSQPPQDTPLGFIDRRTTATEDVVLGDAVIDARNQAPFRFVSSLYRASPRHAWGYFSNMTPHETAVFLAYDRADESLPGVPHCAFDDPTCPAGAPPRASCEIRAFAYWG
jgi:hypothetical protein